MFFLLSSEDSNLLDAEVLFEYREGKVHRLPQTNNVLVDPIRWCLLIAERGAYNGTEPSYRHTFSIDALGLAEVFHHG